MVNTNFGNAPAPKKHDATVNASHAAASTPTADIAHNFQLARALQEASLSVCGKGNTALHEAGVQRFGGDRKQAGYIDYRSNIGNTGSVSITDTRFKPAPTSANELVLEALQLAGVKIGYGVSAFKAPGIGYLAIDVITPPPVLVKKTGIIGFLGGREVLESPEAYLRITIQPPLSLEEQGAQYRRTDPRQFLVALVAKISTQDANAITQELRSDSARGLLLNTFVNLPEPSDVINQSDQTIKNNALLNALADTLMAPLVATAGQKWADLTTAQRHRALDAYHMFHIGDTTAIQRYVNEVSSPK